MQSARFIDWLKRTVSLLFSRTHRTKCMVIWSHYSGKTELPFRMVCQAFPFFKLLLPGFLENSEAYLLFPLPSPSIFRLLSLIDHFHVSCIQYPHYYCFYQMQSRLMNLLLYWCFQGRNRSNKVRLLPLRKPAGGVRTVVLGWVIVTTGLKRYKWLPIPSQDSRGNWP